jgi:2,4-dienoyl-CoA reductase-like NADH-dependent reductase (Old Yellow Enzyme family)
MLLKRVESFLRRTRTPPARFGRDVLRDPNFVFDLKDGREPRRATRRRVLAYIAAQEAELGDTR